MHPIWSNKPWIETKTGFQSALIASCFLPHRAVPQPRETPGVQRPWNHDQAFLSRVVLAACRASGTEGDKIKAWRPYRGTSQGPSMGFSEHDQLMSWISTNWCRDDETTKNGKFKGPAIKSGPLNSYEKGHDCNIVRPFLGHFAAHLAMLLLGALALTRPGAKIPVLTRPA